MISMVLLLIKVGTVTAILMSCLWYVASGNIESDISVQGDNKVLYINKKDGISPSKGGIG